MESNPLDLLREGNPPSTSNVQKPIELPSNDPLSVLRGNEDTNSELIAPGQDSYFDIKSYDEDNNYISIYRPKGMNNLDWLRKQKANDQSAWAEAGNALLRIIPNTVLEVMSNVGSILDVEDWIGLDTETGNWLTTWANEQKQNVNDATHIFRENPTKALDVTDSAWWFENGSSLVTSAAAFAITGYGIAGGVGKLAKGATKGISWLKNLTTGAELANPWKVTQGISSLGNSFLLNQAESIGSATTVFDTVYRQKLEEYDNKLLYGEVIGDDRESYARGIAAEAASNVMNTNRLNILLNLTSGGMFSKEYSAYKYATYVDEVLSPLTRNMVTRELVKLPTKKTTAKHMLSEAIQEYGEETINMIAENRALARANDENYDVLKNVFSREGLEAGLLGAIGGAGQTAFTAAGRNINRLGEKVDGEWVSRNQLQKDRYQKQRKEIERINDVLTSNGLKDFTSVFNDATTQIDLLQEIQKAEEEGNHAKVTSLKERLIEFQSLKAFQNGTTESLIGLYEGIYGLTEDEAKKQKLDTTKDENGQFNYKTKSLEAIQRVQSLEKLYYTTQQYVNGDDVFYNRAKDYDFRTKSGKLYQEYNKSTVKFYDEYERAKRNQQVKGTSSTKAEDGSTIYNPIYIDLEHYFRTGKINQYATGNNPDEQEVLNWAKKNENFIDAELSFNGYNEFEKLISKNEEEYSEITSKKYQEKLKDAERDLYRKQRKERKENEIKKKREKQKKNVNDSAKNTKSAETNEAGKEEQKQQQESKQENEEGDNNNKGNEEKENEPQQEEEPKDPAQGNENETTLTSEERAIVEEFKENIKALIKNEIESGQIVIDATNTLVNYLDKQIRQLAQSQPNNKLMLIAVDELIEEVKANNDSFGIVAEDDTVNNAINTLVNEMEDSSDNLSSSTGKPSYSIVAEDREEDDEANKGSNKKDKEKRRKMIYDMLRVMEAADEKGIAKDDFKGLVKFIQSRIGEAKTMKLFNRFKDLYNAVADVRTNETYETVFFTEGQQRKIQEISSLINLDPNVPFIYTVNDERAVTKYIQTRVDRRLTRLNALAGGSIFDGINYNTIDSTKIKDAAFAGAYLARNYARIAKISTDTNSIEITKEDIDNKLNESMLDANILDSTEFSVGTQITFDMQRDFTLETPNGIQTYSTLLAKGRAASASNKANIQSRIKRLKAEFEQFKQDNVVYSTAVEKIKNGEQLTTEENFVYRVNAVTSKKYNNYINNLENLEEELSLDFSYAYVPIVVKKDGKPFMHIHDLDWVTQENVGGDVNDLLNERRELLKLRNKIIFKIQNGENVTGIISSRSAGKLIKVAGEPILTTEALQDPNLRFGICSDGRIVDNKGEIIELDAPREGWVYALTPFNDNVVPIPLLKQRLKESDVDTIMSAIDAWYNGNFELINKIEKLTGIDIATMTGLKDFVSRFIYNFNDWHTDKSLQEVSKTLSSTAHLFNVNEKTRAIEFSKGMGTYNFISQGTDSSQYQELVTKMREHLLTMHYRFSTDNLSKDTIIPIIDKNDNVTLRTYSTVEWIKENTKSDVMSFKLPNGNYTYSVQPVIRFSLDSSPVEKEEEVKLPEPTPSDDGFEVTGFRPVNNDDLNINDVDFDIFDDSFGIVADSTYDYALNYILSKYSGLIEDNTEFRTYLGEAVQTSNIIEEIEAKILQKYC